MAGTRELLFLNPKLKKGLNLTVRNGDKWADCRPGTTLLIRQTPCERAQGAGAQAVNIQTPAVFGLHLASQVVFISDLEDTVLRFEHDAGCTTVEGLHDALNKAYPKGYGPYVTLVYFWIE